MESFTTRIECANCGHEHECREDEDYAAMLGECRKADPRLLIIDDGDSLFVRIRCREAAKWLRARGVKVTERELTSYLRRNFNAIRFRSRVGMVMLFRKDRQPVQEAGVREGQFRKIYHGAIEHGVLPEQLEDLIMEAVNGTDSAGNPLVWADDEGWAYVRIRPLLYWARDLGKDVRWGERGIKKFMLEDMGGEIVRTRYGRAARVKNDPPENHAKVAAVAAGTAE